MEFLGRTALFLDVVLLLALVYFSIFRASLAFPCVCILALFIFKKVTSVRRSPTAIKFLVQKRSKVVKKDDVLVLPNDYIVIDLDLLESLKGGPCTVGGGKIKNVCTNGSFLEFETRAAPHAKFSYVECPKAEEEKNSTSQGASETIFKNKNSPVLFEGKISYHGQIIDEIYHYVENWGPKGSYKGQFCNGLWHGFGEYHAENGDWYVGTWRYGLKYGTGQNFCSDGTLYTGEFKNGVKHGLGWTKHRHGDWYAGEHEKGEMHGFGAYHFFNGDVYEGMWNNGDMHGYGYYKLVSGESKSGIWEHNVLCDSVPESHPHFYRIIELVRLSALNAFLVKKVDKEVQAAVTDAERAAAVLQVS